MIVTDLTFVNVVYIAGKNIDKIKLRNALVNLKKLVTIISIGDACIEQALNGDFIDFEDTAQYFAAKRENVDFILSRDAKGFKMSKIPVINVSEFLNSFL